MLDGTAEPKSTGKKRPAAAAAEGADQEEGDGAPKAKGTAAAAKKPAKIAKVEGPRYSADMRPAPCEGPSVK